MNRIIQLCFALFFISAAFAQYNLVWQDNFDGNALDQSKWRHEVNCDGGGNNELQCYTNRQDNVYVKDGFLHIRAKPENYNNKGYTSGRINTANTATWKYGRFVTRAKLPRGDYLWPAIWMMPKDSVYGGWAASGEIDIMETRGQTTRMVEGTIHHGSGWPNNVYTGSGPRTFNFDFSEDFHNFELIWERDQIQWLVDGQVYHTQNLVRNFYGGRGANPYNDVRQPFDQRFFFILNLAIGGGFFGGQANALNAATARNWPVPEMVVDYVRVYQLGANPIPNPVPVPSQNVPSQVQPTPAPTSNNNGGNNGACAGKCGGQSCCDDPKLGQICYNPSQYDCPTDPTNNKNYLCGKGLGACSGVCFDLNNYICKAGKIEQKPAGYVPPAQTPAPQPSQANTPAPSQAASTPSQGGNGGCTGCGGGESCCMDNRIGRVCFSTNTHTCATDERGLLQLCGKGQNSCSGACFDPNLYKCNNGRLGPK